MKVLDIRNYQLQPGTTSAFIRLFEDELLGGLAREGIETLGQFHVIGQPDRFLFIRVFPDMAARLSSLHGFYDSEYWFARRPKVNSMLIDSDHVHLVNPLDDVARLTAPRPPGIVAIDFYRMRPEAFDASLQKGLLGRFVCEKQPNDFPRHPVIQDPALHIVLSHWPDGARHAPAMPGAETTVLLQPTERSRMR